jgi:hypothetical protein
MLSSFQRYAVAEVNSRLDSVGGHIEVRQVMTSKNSELKDPTPVSTNRLIGLRFERACWLTLAADKKQIVFSGHTDHGKKPHKGLVYLWIIEPRLRDETSWQVAYVGQSQGSLASRVVTSGRGLNEEVVLPERVQDNGKKSTGLKTGQVLALLIKNALQKRSRISVWTRLSSSHSVAGIKGHKASLCQTEETIFLEYLYPLWNYGRARKHLNRL